MDDDRLKLYIVSCHVDKPLEEEPPRSVYEVPIQAGAALTDQRTCPINDHDGFRESISDRNTRYGEATAMWWIGNHIDTPYVGLEHYRRRLKLSDEELSAYMDDDIDIITTTPIRMTWSVEDNYRHEFWSADWDLFLQILEEYVPEDMPLAREVFAGSMIHCCNINIMKGELYRQFCMWAFPMMDAFYRRSPEKTDVMQHRDVGYISERFSHLFIMKMRAQGKRVAEADVIEVQSSNWSPEKECDPSDPDAVWRSCEKLFRKNRIRECNQLISAAMRQGGLQGERLQDVSELLVTGVMERMELPESMFEYLPIQLRSDLETLLATYTGFRQIVLLWHAKEDEETEKLLSDYLSLTHFSKVVMRRIIEIYGGEDRPDTTG
ncbi:MAG: DUF4422 domain-containing protein [Lachnospiraceae bacterium]|nr:DUF4422 domain-containing protein [Lachnospiraceae bacterium]